MTRDFLERLKQKLPVRRNRQAGSAAAGGSPAIVPTATPPTQDIVATKPEPEPEPEPEPRPDNPRPPTSSPTLSRTDVAFSLWNMAYDEIKVKDEQLVEAYEKILTRNINDGVGFLTVSAANMFANCTAEERLTKMNVYVQKSVERARSRQNVRNGVVQTSALITKLSSIGKEALAPASPPAAMAWSGLCAVFQVFSGPFEAEQSMIDGLEHVISRMDWYLSLSRVLLKDLGANRTACSQLHVPLESQVLGMYRALLGYEMMAVLYCYRNHPVTAYWKTIWGSYDWTSQRDKMAKLEAQLDGDMARFADRETAESLGSLLHESSKASGLLQDMVSSQQAQHGRQIQREVEERQRERDRLIGRFRVVPYEERMKINPNRVPNTCDWFCNHSKFVNWLDQPEGLLVVSADPGCGKSVLSRYLIEDFFPTLEKTQTARICHFFFKDNPEQRSATNAVCSLLHSLFRQEPSLLDYCESLISQGGEDLKSHLLSLWKILEQALGHPSCPPIICVLDALDECDQTETQSFISLLTDYTQSRQEAIGHKHVRFLVTTRGLPPILEDLGKYGLDPIHLNGDGQREKDLIQKEILLVVEHRLSELARKKNLNDENTSVLQSGFTLKGKEDRTYLWVSLVFERLERNRENNKAGWKRLVDDLPQTVYDAYEKLLRRIEPTKADKVTRLFSLVVAAQRPLTVAEANVALSAWDKRQSAYSENNLDLNADFADWVKETCGLFVTIYADQLFFIHQTAKEFLLANEKRRPGMAAEWDETRNPWRESITSTQAHRVMAECCIAYLSLDVFHGDAFRFELSDAMSVNDRIFWGHHYDPDLWSNIHIVPSTFCRYASYHWDMHFVEAQSATKNGIEDISDAFWSDYISLFGDNTPITMPWTTLAASKYEYHENLHALVDQRRFQCIEGLTRAGLSAALGHLRVMKYFLAQDLDQNTRPSAQHMRGLALQQTNDNADENSQGLEVPDSPSGKAWPPVPVYQPIFIAVEHKNHESLRYILSNFRSSQIEAHGQDGEKLLYFAANCLNFTAMDILLHNGFDFTVEDQQGRNILDTFVKIPRLGAIVEREAARRVLRFLWSKSGVSDWHPVWPRLLPMVVRWLEPESPALSDLEKKITQAYRTGFSRSAWNAFRESQAFRKAYEESLIKELVDRGEVVDALDEHELAPLTCACEKSVFWNFMFLLESKACVNYIGLGGHSPLQYLCIRSSKGDERGHILLAVLILSGADVNFADGHRVNPFHHLLGANRMRGLRPLRIVTLARLFLENGASATAPSQNGFGALHLVRKAGSTGEVVQLVDLLLKYGADLEAVDDEGNTPLLHALLFRFPWVTKARALILKGANLHASNKAGNTPVKRIRYLRREMEAGGALCDPEDKDSARKGLPRVVELLAMVEARESAGAES